MNCLDIILFNMNFHNIVRLGIKNLLPLLSGLERNDAT